ncbi:AzlC family ABC transporter permease [Oceanibium sediminis]|uniref:AzlC family ABC transporter permease n=1 Tax=Oceanibium sediminis TaxID=2026339 RepID=UPI000DD30632|nr:AzlC family ABC transporter permease [Oceanibium sediminis]
MTTDTRSQILRGAIDASPFLLIMVPFSMLFGVVATEAGFSIAQTLSMSVVVIAGAAQFTAIQLMVDDAPTIIVLLTALAVNLRMAMYSAALVPHVGTAPRWQRAFAAYFLVDQVYGMVAARYEAHPEHTITQKMAYYFGVAIFICPWWYLFTYIGAVAGGAIPPDYGLDFAVAIAFIAMIAPQLKSLAHVAAAFVSVVLALGLAWVPLNLGLIIAAFAAMLTGALVETWRVGRT